MQIDADFDAGNIIVDDIRGEEALLTIRPDSGADYFQWFYFRVTGMPGVARSFRIVNANQASYPQAWEGYQVLASSDEADWFRVATTYDGGQLAFSHRADWESTAYAFFVPYPAARRERFLAECEQSPLVTRRVIGRSLQNRPLDMLLIGDEARDGRRVWVVTRQHAGEPMAERATEGLVRRLLNQDDAVSRSLLERATFYVVPNMNPDGSALGNLRANAAGVDLNRVWHAPPDEAPEVAAALEAIKDSGVDYFLDLHGDEARPFIWLAQPQVEQSAGLQAVQRRFEDELAQRHRSVQPAPESIVRGEARAPGMSVNHITTTYHCPAWIVELPFKAVSSGNNPDSLLAAGCADFGGLCVEVLNTIIE